MDKKEIAEECLAGINVRDHDAAEPYVAENLTYSGPIPEPVDFQEWRAMAAPFRSAFPDWSFNAQGGAVEDNVVAITVHVTATHSGDLDLTAMGMGVVPASGMSISMPASTGRLTFEGDKVANLHVDTEEGGGLLGLLAKLGVTGP